MMKCLQGIAHGCFMMIRGPLRDLVLSDNEKALLSTASDLWLTVHVGKRRRWGEVLEQAEVMLVLRILEEDSRWHLPGSDYRKVVTSFCNHIKVAYNMGKMHGSGVTKQEFIDSMSAAMAHYGQTLMVSIKQDVQKEYLKMIEDENTPQVGWGLQQQATQLATQMRNAVAGATGAALPPPTSAPAHPEAQHHFHLHNPFSKSEPPPPEQPEPNPRKAPVFAPILSRLTSCCTSPGATDAEEVELPAPSSRQRRGR